MYFRSWIKERLKWDEQEVAKNPLHTLTCPKSPFPSISNACLAGSQEETENKTEKDSWSRIIWHSLSVVVSIISHANRPVNRIIYFEKQEGFLTKQGHHQPCFHSKAKALSTQLQNGILECCWTFLRLIPSFSGAFMTIYHTFMSFKVAWRPLQPSL